MDIRVIDNKPTRMLKFTCGHCGCAELLEDKSILKGSKPPEHWATVIVDFYGNNEGGPHGEYLCPDCKTDWLAKTRQFFRWPEHTWKDGEE